MPVPAPAAAARTGHKLLVLESVRGIAALAVFNYHFLDLLARQVWESPLAVMLSSPLGVVFAVAQLTPLNVFVNPELAVRTFFVLSGLVLSWKFCHERNDDILRAAALKRCIRLAIPISASLIVAFVVYRVFSSHDVLLQLEPIADKAMIRQDVRYAPVWWDAVKQSIKVMFLGVDHRTLNRSLWTMQHELLGSYVVFGFLMLFGRMRYRAAAYLAAAAVALLVWRPFVIDFLIGMGLCEIVAHFRGHRRMIARFQSCALPCAAIGVGFMMTWYPLQDHGWQNAAFVRVTPAAAAGLLLFGVLYSPWLQAPLRLRVFAFFGRISFASYLLHLPVIYGIGGWIFKWAYDVSGSYTNSFLASYAGSLLALLLTADAFTRYVDAPTIGLTQWLAKTLAPPPAAPVGAGAESR